MYFSDIQNTSKDEQVRAHALDKALESYSSTGLVDRDQIIRRAESFEKYITAGTVPEK